MTEMLSDLEAIYKTLEENHNDWLTWGVLADWYEEHGGEEAVPVRWMVTHLKRPYWSRTNVRWCWFGKAGRHPTTKLGQVADYESDLRMEVFKHMPEIVRSQEEISASKSLKVMVGRFCTAFRRATEEGWDGNP